jgi:glycosyltransferase involved in cell wall biosynthesis
MKTTDILAGFATDFRTEQRLYRQVRSLCRAGRTVAVAGFCEPGRAPVLSHWDCGEIIPLPVRRKGVPGFLFFLVFMAKLLWTALKIRPPLYLACDLPALIPFALASLLAGGEVIYDSREIFTELPDIHRAPLKKRLCGLLERFSIRRARIAITVCEADGAVLRGKYPGVRSVVIRNLPLFSLCRKSNALRERLGLPDDEPLVLFQGTFLRSGGVRELVLAASGLDRGRIVLIGDGPERENILPLIKNTGKDQRVIWLPPVPFSDLHPLSCSADIGVFPAKPDGLNLINALPNKIFEYAMAGLPVISTDLPEIRKMNDQYHFALLVTEITPENLSTAIKALIAEPALAQRLAENGLKMARELCWENEEKKFLALFDTKGK